MTANMELFTPLMGRTLGVGNDDPPTLRDYQQAAVEGVHRELKESRGTLVLMATGLGKTQVASELIRTWPGRTCFIAHREKLIEQAANRIEQFIGCRPNIEKAAQRASVAGDVPVVASIQSLAREARLERFPRDAFSLIVVDEVHHGVSATYRAVLDYFTGAKLVGLTATPDRLDGAALGQILDSVAYRYELNQAIEDGWLAPIRMRAVRVDGIDFSNVKTNRGDFNQTDLDALMAREENLHGIAKPAVELSGDRSTIIFTTSIDNAHRMAEIIDRYTGRASAVSIDSKMDSLERDENLRLYESGERQFLINVGIATEGYDHPPTSCVVMGRPTKSRALFVQMLGRGTRGGRRWPIEGKEDCLVIDFVGSSEDHEIVTATDALAGDVSDEEARLIKSEVEKAEQEISIDEARQLAKERQRKVEEEAERQRQKRAHVKARVAYRDFDPNPYVSLGVRRDFLHEKYGYASATDNQLATLRKMTGKHAKDLPANLGKLEASRLIGKMVDRRKRGLCTYPQMAALEKRGISAKEMKFDAARRVLDGLARNGWKPLTQDQIDGLVSG